MATLPTTRSIRLPADVDERLTELASEHDRSVNGEIVAALRHWCASFRENPGGFLPMPPRLAEQIRQANK